MKIDKAVCLCLDKRESEWRQLIEDGKKVGLDIQPFICGDGSSSHLQYSRIDDIDPDITYWQYGREGYKHHHYNAFKCHQQMISEAKAEGIENLLILEDDAYLTSRYTEVMDLITSNFHAIPKFDILYLGWWIGNEGDEFNDAVEAVWEKTHAAEIRKVQQLGGLHGVILNNSIYDGILSLPPINPIDCQLNYFHDRIASYFVLPKIIHIKTTYSYCEGSVITRNQI